MDDDTEWVDTVLRVFWMVVAFVLAAKAKNDIAGAIYFFLGSWVVFSRG